MQIQLYSIPVLGGEAITEEMNRFLRSQKVLKVDQVLTGEGDQAIWCFCIKYLQTQVDVSSPDSKKNRIDYKELLDEESFARFARFREIRKQIAEEESIPAYAVFTNAELAELARIPELTKSAMKSVKGIGEKKAASYGKYFINPVTDEASGKPEA